ncbi:MAG: LytTR family DNA-binding domain-containing protein [Clostridia bacterium]|nr:LytTR family DNA-binding domain-containing protein [Clostridia bacterium]
MTEKQSKTVFKIAVCDDETTASERICNLLAEHSRADELAISVYHRCEDLLAALNSGVAYDLIFLDIEFSELNGLDTSAILRRTLEDNLTQIVYVSSHTSYAIELFQFRPLDFLEKPVSREKVHRALNLAMELMRGEDQYFTVNIYKEMYRIPCREIRYFELYHKQLSVHTVKKVYTCYSYSVESIAKFPEFIQIHKSFFVNIHHVYSHRYDSLTLNDQTELPISRPYRVKVREALLGRTTILF